MVAEISKQLVSIHFEVIDFVHCDAERLWNIRPHRHVECCIRFCWLEKYPDISFSYYFKNAVDYFVGKTGLPLSCGYLFTTGKLAVTMQ
jgi:hypothetical protein